MTVIRGTSPNRLQDTTKLLVSNIKVKVNWPAPQWHTEAMQV
jgi:hypothetical protein